MSLEEVKAKTSDMEEHVLAQFDFGDGLDEAIEKFGEDVVFARYKASAVIDLQSAMRGWIKQKKPNEEIAKLASEWKPGTRQSRGKTKEEKARDALGRLSDVERAALLEEYMAS